MLYCGAWLALGYHMVRTHYYALQKTGDGPVELRASARKVVITRRSAEKWNGRTRSAPRTMIPMML